MTDGLSSTSENFFKGHRSRRGQVALEVRLMAAKVDRKNPLPEHKTVGVKGYSRVIWSQAEVNLPRIALLLPNFVERTPWPECNAWLGSRVIQGSIRGQIA